MLALQRHIQAHVLLAYGSLLCCTYVPLHMDILANAMAHNVDIFDSISDSTSRLMRACTNPYSATTRSAFRFVRCNSLSGIR